MTREGEAQLSGAATGLALGAVAGSVTAGFVGALVGSLIVGPVGLAAAAYLATYRNSKNTGSKSE